MFFALFQLVTYLNFMIFVHFIAPTEKNIFSFIAIAFAIIASGILLSAYFIQFSVVPISLMKGETEGIALISQYNGHGLAFDSKTAKQMFELYCQRWQI
jgi:hypothetical protein